MNSPGTARRRRARGVRPRPLLIGVGLAAALVLAGVAALHDLVHSSNSHLNLDTPTAIVSDDRGNVYVADAGNHRVLKLSLNGVPVGFFVAPGKGPRAKSFLPEALAVDSHGTVYVVNDNSEFGGEDAGASLYKYSSGGRYLGTLAAVDTYSALATDRQGNVYVTFPRTDQIVVFSPSGTVLRRIGHFGHKPGELDRPRAITVDRAGNIEVVETGHPNEQRTNPRLQKLSPDGGSLGTYTNTLQEFHQTSSALATDSRGMVYVLTLPDRVDMLTSSLGGPQTIIVPSVTGVAAGPSGSIYALDQNGGTVSRYSTSGRLLARWR